MRSAKENCIKILINDTEVSSLLPFKGPENQQVRSTTSKLQVSLISTVFDITSNGILLPKLFLPSVRKKCSSDREKLLKFEAEGLEFGKVLRSPEKFVGTVKGQNNFW